MNVEVIKDICSTKNNRIPIEIRTNKEKARNFIKTILDEKIPIVNNDIYTLSSWAGIPLNNGNDTYVEIDNIEYIGKKQTYDLEIADSHSYVANGIICHNTTNLPNTATRDEVSELYRYAYQKKLKGITIYRDGCKKDQPISFTTDKQQVKSNYERPTKLQGTVHTIETGNGKMYVTVSTLHGKPKEIFISIGKSGQFLNNFCEALGRTISISLQHGVPVDAIYKTLVGINSDRVTWFRFEETDKKPSQLLSIPDAIAQLLKRYYMGDNSVPDDVPESTGEMCTKCGSMSVVKIEGCSTCLSCADSRCG